jgi:mRNA interferase MazF
VAAILRGTIHWTELNPVSGHDQAGTRPAVILRHDMFNDRSGTVIAMAITNQAQRAGFPLSYELKDEVQSMKAWVKISQIRTLSTERIGKSIGQVSAEEMAEIIEGLNEIISG